MKINSKIINFLLYKKYDYIKRALTRYVTKSRDPTFDILRQLIFNIFNIQIIINVINVMMINFIENSKKKFNKQYSLINIYNFLISLY